MVPAFLTGKESTMLKVNELFSGIGAQSAALKRLEIDFEVVATADTDKDALVSYAALHCKAPTEYEYPAATYMADYLAERNIGYDFEKNKPYDWHRLISKKTGKASERLKKYYLSCIISKNRGDVSKIEKLEYADFWTYSFPCQDISVAGKQAGIEKHTRSGLLYEVERLLNVSAEHGELPKYLMLENVKNLVGKKFKAQFEEWLQALDELGYNNYWKILNAKHYGIPQNRERVFGISIRKDVDTGGFSFPEGFDNGLRLKDFLEDEVDEKFYISQEKTEKLISQIKLNNPSIKREPGKADGVYTNQSLNFTRPPLKDLSRTLKANVHDAAVVMPIDKSYNNPKPIEIANCITAREDRGISNHQAVGTAVMESDRPIRLGNIYGEDKGTGFAGNVWEKEALSPTLTTMQGGNREPMIVEEPAILRPERTEYGKAIRKQYEAGEVEESRHNMTELHPREDGISNTLTTVQKDNMLLEPKIVCEQRTDEGLRFFKDGCVGTLRTIDACGDKRVLVKEATKQGYAIAEEGDSINIQFPNSETRRGRVGKECAQTLETSCNQATLASDYDIVIQNKINISKLYNILLYIDILCDIITVRGSDYIERDTDKVLQMLWETIGTQAIQWTVGGFGCIQQKDILRQNVHEAREVECGSKSKQLEQFTCNGKTNQRFNYEEGQMRRMWEGWKSRYTPQGFELSEQRYRQFDDFMQKLSHENTQDKKGLYCMWRASEGVGVLQQALLEIQKIWGSLNDETKSDLQSMWRTCERKTIMWQTLSRVETEGAFRIRKLTPRTCFRLMGFTDEEFQRAVDAGVSNSQLYRQAGNSIVTDVLYYIFKNLLK